MVNAQEYINQKYPPKIRKNVKKIRISLLFGKKLKGSLNLEGFTKLEKFDCS